MNYSLALSKVRFETGMKQKEVAAKAKVSASYLSQVENGAKEPSSELIKRLCKVYGIPHIVLAWYASDETDVPKHKRAIYKELSPAIDALTKHIVTMKK